MSYRLKYSKDFTKFLEKHMSLAPTILERLEIIAESPFDNNLDIKRLKNRPNHYRLRVGKYRILYVIIENEILIYAYDADSRGDIYK